MIDINKQSEKFILCEVLVEVKIWLNGQPLMLQGEKQKKLKEMIGLIADLVKEQA